MRQRVCFGLPFGSSNSGDPVPQGEVRRPRGGDGAPLQVDGLLLQGGALLRREGRHDRVRQVEDSGAGRAVQFEGRNAQTGKQEKAKSLFKTWSELTR